MSSERVAYLIGAGGTHACIKSVGSSHGILMSDLSDEIGEKVGEMSKVNPEYRILDKVINEVVVGTTDIEHVITFFDESPSSRHRGFARELRSIFEDVLRSKLVGIANELGEDRHWLYSAFIDMHNTDSFKKSLNGILTLNYDDYIEGAASQLLAEEEIEASEADVVCAGSIGDWRLLKLHGSFGWEDSWPVVRREIADVATPLWVPPGIRKSTDRYPFNLIWGLAREVLNCDLLRIIGCRLGPSDWGLISLLFSTRYSNVSQSQPYSIEVIDSPDRAAMMKDSYPYLEIRSIFEIDALDIGAELASDLLGDRAKRFDELCPKKQDDLITQWHDSGVNWFKLWLEKVGAGLFLEGGEDALLTPTNVFKEWFEA